MTASPINPYGMTKFVSEKIIDDFSKSRQFGYIILRYFNVGGASVGGDNGPRAKKGTSLIKVAAETAAGKRAHVEIFGTDYPTVDGTGVPMVYRLNADATVASKLDLAA